MNGLYALLNYFVDLCLLRAVPQALPASGSLFRVLLGANVLVGILLVVGEHLGAGLALLESLFEVALTLGLLALVLRLRGHPGRFVQAGTAVMGCNVLLGLVALPVLGLDAGDGGELATLAALLLLVLLVWNLVVLGHILRHALDLALGQGVALAAAYTLVSYFLIASLFPVA